ncbi:MAG: DNA polymerase III subunit alpha [Candidatus Magnetoovum sp. WYHC-5]|nr:DNA polymerase III subunit alpha [Candidatus Magnetoovum sp. WYHC-5]
MQKSDFVALHVHTEYSLLDGAIRINELVDRAIEYNMPAVAITDHGNLFGAVEFYRKATDKGIKPIIGCEVYLSDGKYTEKIKTRYYHLILLAKNPLGYKNLVYLATQAYTEGFYYKPRIDKELLATHSQGLIALSACLKGEVPYYLVNEQTEQAKKSALWYKEVFGREDFYLEIQDNGLPEQDIANKRLVELSTELDIQLAATNDCHYMDKADAEAHDILICIQTSKTINDTDRLKFTTDTLYFKSPKEMQLAFKELPRSILNTREIADKCDFHFKLGEFMLPHFETGQNQTPETYMEALARKGADQKLPQPISSEYAKRFDTELEVIKNMGFASYFLIVWDFINYARTKGIPVGPGRGSAAGSLIAYCLGITDIDPLKYNLLFERFLNPERISMPDIDVDFCRDRRSEVISYTAQRYGKDHVAQIITFGTMAAKAAIRDVGRAMALPYSFVDSIAKLIPTTLNITLKEALKEEEEFKKAYNSSGEVKKLVDIAMRLEGLCRHASTHAAGVVISPGPLVDYAPLYKNPTDETITTQFDMGSIEKIGLLKFDFLGLKTLTVIDKTINYLKERGKPFELKTIPLDDKETYEMLGRGQTIGVFQLESSGMRDIIIKMRPNLFEDLIALVALYRPGPLGSGMIDDFIKRKKGVVPVSYEHPLLADVLNETYGIILYQEQVMRIANKMAGFTMGQADILRKAMGKKKIDEMEKLKGQFIEGSIKNQIDKALAEKIFDLMAQFAKYGFNKSHSAAYAYISYQTAYLKAHFPVEFMAANMSSEDATEKIVKFINECKEMSIDILLPDINEGQRQFKIIDNAIMFGLEAVKGVGSTAIESILNARQQKHFEGLEDFIKRVDSRKVNKKVIESLIKAGSFDRLIKSRAQAIKELEDILSGAHAMPRLFGHSSALSGGINNGINNGTNNIDEWSESEKLKYERETLGFYISSHPLRNYTEQLQRMGVCVSYDFDNMLYTPDEVKMAGSISQVKKKLMRDKSGKIAILQLEDKDAHMVEVIVFKDLLQKMDKLLTKDNLIIVKGKLEKNDNGYKMIAAEITDLDTEVNNSYTKMNITMAEQNCNKDTLVKIKKILEANSQGNLFVYLNIQGEDYETVISTSYRASKDNKLIRELADGIQTCTVTLN